MGIGLNMCEPFESVKNRESHDTLPLLGASKWESQEGCYAYVKAYMVLNGLSIVRVVASRYDSCFYMIRSGMEFMHKNYTSRKDMEAPCVNHYTDEVTELAKALGFIPEEEDDESDWFKGETEDPIEEDLWHRKICSLVLMIAGEILRMQMRLSAC